MRKQHKRIAASENQIVIAYTKPKNHHNNLLNTQFLNYTKTLSHKKQNGFSPSLQTVQSTIPQDDSPIQQIRESFIEICDRQSIPPFYSNHLLNYSSLLSIQQQKPLLIQEICDIEAGQSYYQDITRLLSARANCIQKLKIGLSGNTDNSELISRQSELEKFCCILSHLRLLTVMVIEKTESWRRSLVELQLRGKKNESITSQPIIFLSEGKSVLNRIFRDTFFLHMSSLRKYIQFSKGFDPLMLGPLRKIQNNSATRMRNYDSVVRLFEVGLEMKSRLQAAEIVLTEELVMNEEQKDRGYDNLQETKKHSSYKKTAYRDPSQFKSTFLIKEERSQDLSEEESERLVYTKPRRKDFSVDLGRGEKQSGILPPLRKDQNRTENQSKRYRTQEDHPLQNTSYYNSPERRSTYKVRKDRMINEILQHSKLPSISAQAFRSSQGKHPQKKAFFGQDGIEESNEYESEEGNLQPSPNSPPLNGYKTSSPERRAGMIRRRDVSRTNFNLGSTSKDQELQKRIQMEKMYLSRLVRSSNEVEEPRVLRRNPQLNYSLTKIEYKITGESKESLGRVSKEDAPKRIMSQIEQRTEKSSLVSSAVNEGNSIKVKRMEEEGKEVGEDKGKKRTEAETRVGGDTKQRVGDKKVEVKGNEELMGETKTLAIKKESDDVKEVKGVKEVKEAKGNSQQTIAKSEQKQIEVGGNKESIPLSKQEQRVDESVKRREGQMQQNKIRVQQQKRINRERQDRVAEEERQRKRGIEKGKEIEREKERQRQIEVERDKQREKERQREKEKERQREVLRQKQIQKQRQKKIEEQKQRQRTREREREIQIKRQMEKQREKQREIQKQKEIQRQRQKQIEMQRQKEKKREREVQIEKQRKKEIQRQKQQKQQKERQKEKQRLINIEKQKEIQREKQKQKEKQREKEKQRQIERQRQILVKKQKEEQTKREAEIPKHQQPQQPQQPQSESKQVQPAKPLDLTPKQVTTQPITPQLTQPIIQPNTSSITQSRKQSLSQPSRKDSQGSQSKQKSSSQPKQQQFKLFITSKNFLIHQLGQYLQSITHLFSPSQFPTIKQLIIGTNKQFLHIYIHQVKINTTIAGLIISSPVLREKRVIRVYLCRLLYTVVELKKTYKILSNFLDFIWTQDPCDEIHFLQLKDHPDYQMVEILKEMKVKTQTFEPPFPEISEEYYVLHRRKKCKNQDSEDCLFKFQNLKLSIPYTPTDIFEPSKCDLFSAENYYSPQLSNTLINYHNQQYPPPHPAPPPLPLPASFKMKMTCNQFPNIPSLNKYLNQQQLPPFQTTSDPQNLSLLKCILYDSFQSQFIVNKNIMILPVKSGYVEMYQSTTTVIVLIKIKRSYGDMFLTFIKTQNSKGSVQSLVPKLVKETLKPGLKCQDDDLVGIRFFKKHIQGRVMDYQGKVSVFGRVDISLNWVDYLKGVKLVDEEDIFITFADNYYLALLDEAHSMLFATLITAKDLL